MAWKDNVDININMHMILLCRKKKQSVGGRRERDKTENKYIHKYYFQQVKKSKYTLW